MLLYIKLRYIENYILPGFNSENLTFEDLLDFCRKNQIKVFEIPTETNAFRGYLLPSKEPVIYINKNVEESLKPWIVAHELGHLFLNCHPDLDKFESAVRKVFDRQANLFSLMCFYSTAYLDKLSKDYGGDGTKILNKMVEYLEEDLRTNLDSEDKRLRANRNLKWRLDVYTGVQER